MTSETVSELITRFAPREKYNNPFMVMLDTTLEAGCDGIIIEHEYVDKDYLDEYSLFYSTCFKDYYRLCTRLHFFNNNVLKKLDLIDCPNKWGVFTNDELSLLQDNYVGFSVIRPLDICTVGRTVIRPYIPNDNYEFVLSQCRTPVNINGVDLNATGMPYLQQDTQTGVCASSALWMAARYMHHRFGYKKYTIPEITNAANKTSHSRPFPATDGLTIDQIVSALVDMGFAPIVYSTRYQKMSTESIIYKYLESELPVILALDIPGIGGHAILVVGHNFLPKNYVCSISHLKNVNYIDTFIVHDDARGPYINMPFNECIQGDTEYSLKNVIGIIVPAHKKLFLKGEDAEEHARVLLYEQLLVNSTLCEKITNKAFIDAYQSRQLVFRTYYTTSNKFKENIINSGMPSKLVHFYKNMGLPKYIWITEISSPQFLERSRKEERLIYGEIIIDSTGGPNNPENYLAIHCPGVIFLRYPNIYVIDDVTGFPEEKKIIEPIPDDAPYSSLTRIINTIYKCR